MPLRLPARLRRLLPGAPADLGGEVRQVVDDLPPNGLAAPVHVAALEASFDASLGRAEFRVVVRDANGQRCPNLAVEARVTGPSRSGTDEIPTDLMGAVTFRMADGPGRYSLEVLDLGAHGIAWDPTTGAGTIAHLEG